MPSKRRIFISFDHDDTDKVNGFLGLRNILDGFEFFNHKLEASRINSTDANYVHGSSGRNTLTPRPSQSS